MKRSLTWLWSVTSPFTCTEGPVATVGALAVSTGGVTCQVGWNDGLAVPPAFTSVVATNAGRPGSSSTRVNAPALPVTLNAAPDVALPMTSESLVGASRRGTSARRTLTVPLAASGAGEAATTLILILSVTDSPSTV